MPTDELAPSRQWRFFGRYQPIPDGPDPESLATRLHEAKMAKSAAKRFSEFDRYQERHAEHRRALMRGIGSVAAITLGLSPAVPGTYKACHSDDRLDCTLKVAAIIGGAIAVGLGIWAATELFQHPVKLRNQAQKVSREMANHQQGKNGQVDVDDVLVQYRAMNFGQRRRFRDRLAEHVRNPLRRPPPEAVAVDMPPALERRESPRPWPLPPQMEART